jgi:putative cell wall-binding protein
MRFKSRSRALAVAALSASVGLAGLTLAAAPAQATEPTDVVRVAGTTRYGTAAEAATQAYPTGSTNVVLASGEKFPDALAGGGLAGSLDAPILLAQQNAVPAETTAALAELGADNVTILGGTEAISAAVEAGLEAAGLTVDRVGGEDRFETALLIAEELGGDTAVLANGLNFPDALAISPGTHSLELPLLLTTAATLHADAAAFLGDDTVENVIIVGGTAVVSQAIEDALEADGKTVTRLAGVTRYETSVEIAEFHTTVGFTLAEVTLATGEQFPDALAGGPYASQMGAPMVLTQTNTLTPATAAFLTENCQAIDTLHILGGTLAVSAAVEDAAAAAAQCDVAASVATTRPELASAQIVSTTTTGQATAANPAGTVVSYTFDEPVTSATFGNFFVYTAAGAPNAADSATISSTDNRTVLARYNDVTTAAAAAQLTTATVKLGAVTDAAGQQNPEGDAAIGTGGQSTLTAGTTAAPDLLSVGGFRGPLAAPAPAGTVAVDFVFDQAAFVQAAAAPSGLFLVSTDGRIVECTAPLESSSGNTTPSGQNVVGGNGTTTITATCGQFAAAGPLPATTATSTNVARGVAEAGAVGTTPDVSTVNGVTPAACGAVNADGVTNRCNPLQATNTPDVASVRPDLVSATFVPTANPAGFDQVTYTFDENVQPGTVVAANFNVYNNNGVQTAGGAVGPPAPQVNGAQVAVFYPFGTLADEVGASAEAGAVTAVAGTNLTNLDDEVGVANPAATTITPGRTAAPDLTAVSLTSQTVGFVTTWTATYTFDEALSGATAAGLAPQLFLHLADGARMVCNAGGVTIGTGLNGLTTSQVACNSYTFVDGVPDQSGTNTGAATAAQIGSAVLGTVNQTGAAGSAADAGGNFAPEGAEVTTRPAA